MEDTRVSPQSLFNVWSPKLNAFLDRPNGPYGTLHQWQRDATVAARDFLTDPAKPDIGIVVLPTGAGKTGVAVLCAYACNASRVLVITPSTVSSRNRRLDNLVHHD
jgi:superfamily II DNA or RNA helicase